MARKKKRWRDMDDPKDIFGGDRSTDADEARADPAYDAFRRHIDEHIQGETRAFHELRSTAEHELQASAVTTSPPRLIETQKKHPSEARHHPSLPPSSMMQALPENKGLGVGTVLVLSSIFGLVGVLAHNAWQQSQPMLRSLKSKEAIVTSASRNKSSADPNCLPEKTPSKKSASSSPKTAKLPLNTTEAKALAVVTAVPPEPTAASVPSAIAPTPMLEVTAPSEPFVKAITIRAVELRKGPGTHFEIIDSMPPGFALEGVMTTDRQWLRIKTGGFIAAEALQLQDSSLGQSYQSFWVGPHIANVREFPLTTARILRKAEAGVELKLQNFNGEWARVAEGGFIFRKLVTDQSPKTLQLPALMRVTVEKAEIHSGPGKQFPVLGLYFKNHRVEVQDLQDGWLRIGPDQFIRAQEMEISVNPNPGKTM